MKPLSTITKQSIGTFVAGIMIAFITWAATYQFTTRDITEENSKRISLLKNTMENLPTKDDLSDVRSELGQLIEKNDKRISLLKNTVENLPTKDDLSDVRDDLSDVRSELGQLTGEVRNMSRQLIGLNNHLLGNNESDEEAIVNLGEQ